MAEDGSTKYIAEYAKTARAGCKRCKSKIDKGELRIGGQAEIMDHLTTQWRHFDCWSVPKKLLDVGEIEGLDQLSADDRERLIERVKQRYQVPRQAPKKKAPATDGVSDGAIAVSDLTSSSSAASASSSAPKKARTLPGSIAGGSSATPAASSSVAKTSSSASKTASGANQSKAKTAKGESKIKTKKKSRRGDEDDDSESETAEDRAFIEDSDGKISGSESSFDSDALASDEEDSDDDGDDVNNGEDDEDEDPALRKKNEIQKKRKLATLGSWGTSLMPTTATSTKAVSSSRATKSSASQKSSSATFKRTPSSGSVSTIPSSSSSSSSKQLPICPFGFQCYRTRNPHHCAQYSHPFNDEEIAAVDDVDVDESDVKHGSMITSASAAPTAAATTAIEIDDDDQAPSSSSLSSSSSSFLLPSCPYGVKCYRTGNPKHCAEFSHPATGVSPSNANDSGKAALKHSSSTPSLSSSSSSSKPEVTSHNQKHNTNIGKNPILKGCRIVLSNEFHPSFADELSEIIKRRGGIVQPSWVLSGADASTHYLCDSAQDGQFLHLDSIGAAVVFAVWVQHCDECSRRIPESPSYIVLADNFPPTKPPSQIAESSATTTAASTSSSLSSLSKSVSSSTSSIGKSATTKSAASESHASQSSFDSSSASSSCSSYVDPLTLMPNIFKGYVIALTDSVASTSPLSDSGESRADYVRRHVFAFGGEVPAKIYRRCTHVLYDAPILDEKLVKLCSLHSNSIRIVKSDWVVACVKQGKVVDDAPFLCHTVNQLM